jgi:hypothetical protein
MTVDRRPREAPSSCGRPSPVFVLSMTNEKFQMTNGKSYLRQVPGDRRSNEKLLVDDLLGHVANERQFEFLPLVSFDSGENQPGEKHQGNQ